MLKSLTGLQLDADALIRSWYSWKRGALIAWTNTDNGPVRLIELRGLQSNARSYARQARDLMTQAGFASLTQDVKDDVSAIAEEMELGIDEIEQVAHPDNAWAKLDLDKKADVTQHVSANDRDVAAIRERLAGNRRGTIPPKPDKP